MPGRRGIDMIKKIVFLFLINFIFLIILAFVSITQLKTLSSLNQKLYEHPFAVLNAARIIQTNIIYMHSYMKEMASFEDVKNIQIAKKHLDANQKIILEQFNVIFKQYLGDKKDIQSSYNFFLKWEPIRNEVINLIQNKKKEEALAITKAEGAEYIANLDLEINKLITFAENKANFFYQNTLKAETKAQEFVIVFLGIISFIALFTFIILLQNILKKDKEIKSHIDTIEFNYKFERYANHISNYLMNEKDFDTCVDKIIQELGTTLNAHRAYLFLFKDNYSLIDNTHEWCSKGTEAEIENLQNLSTQNLPWWTQQCKELKPLIIEDIRTLPKEAKNEQASFVEQNIKSLLVYPVISQEKSIGFVGIDMVHHHQKWTNTHHSFVKRTAESIADLLEKKKYEEEAFASRYKMALTLNTASNGILAIDENHKLSFYNQKFLQIWELDALDESIDTLEKVFELVSLQFSNYDKCLVDFNHFCENKVKEQLYLFHLKNGKVIEITSAPSFDNAKFKGNSISFRDITKRISLEKELKLSAKVFENSLEGIIITDTQTNIIKVNDSFLKISGYSRDELIGNKPKVLKSSWHDEQFYADMWKTLHKDSIWEGELKDRRKNGELYINLSTLIVIKDSEGDISNYIGINRDITDMKKAQDHIKSLAYYDSLTDLPNRTLFYDRLEQSTKHCQRNKCKLALLFIDLDNFKAVNDTHGHQMGDLLLQKVAMILSSNIRASDTVCRLGGDEFTIILENVNNKNDVIQIANNIITQLLEPIVVNETPLNIGSSIGVAIYPDDTEDTISLLKMADTAMYKAKNNGKNCLKFFK